MSKKASKSRLSAEKRREQVIEAAIHEFAYNGLAGSSTQAISDAVGVSQPYLFKLFGTKHALFLAAYDCVMDRIHETFDAVAATNPDDPMRALEEAFETILERRDDSLLILQAYAASGNEDVRLHVRDREANTFAQVLEMTDGDAEMAQSWIALGLLSAVGDVLDLSVYRD